ncbi:hypothetical protein DFH07DRAFT_551505 [Mycena maculata]|uniref:Uncharacterized protein n=1 Tax=Mycena maculata TaxID=230809 RepID=A0AAD7N8H0_9AGAR|nr:hypothetical protein DFH07DRAFT_551505 [Mycena maculata]
MTGDLFLTAVTSHASGHAHCETNHGDLQRLPQKLRMARETPLPRINQIRATETGGRLGRPRPLAYLFLRNRLWLSRSMGQHGASGYLLISGRNKAFSCRTTANVPSFRTHLVRSLTIHAVSTAGCSGQSYASLGELRGTISARSTVVNGVIIGLSKDRPLTEGNQSRACARRHICMKSKCPYTLPQRCRVDEEQDRIEATDPCLG